MQGLSKSVHWTFQAPGIGGALMLAVGLAGCVDSNSFKMGSDVPTYAQYPTTRGVSSGATPGSAQGVKTDPRTGATSSEAPRVETSPVEPVESNGGTSSQEEARPTGSPTTSTTSTTTSSGAASSQDSTSEALPEPEPELEPDTRPRVGVKGLGDKCEADGECHSGSCRSIAIEFMGFEIQTKTCAECSDHESCMSNGSGLACMPRVLDLANRNRSYFACSQGERGNLCQRDGHCGGNNVCARLIHGLPLIPEIPIETCGQCRSDRDCKDPNRPLCRLNVPVRNFRLPAHNTCVSR